MSRPMMLFAMRVPSQVRVVLGEEDARDAPVGRQRILRPTGRLGAQTRAAAVPRRVTCGFVAALPRHRPVEPAPWLAPWSRSGRRWWTVPGPADERTLRPLL